MYTTVLEVWFPSAESADADLGCLRSVCCAVLPHARGVTVGYTGGLCRRVPGCCIGIQYPRIHFLLTFDLPTLSTTTMQYPTGTGEVGDLYLNVRGVRVLVGSPRGNVVEEGYVLLTVFD